MQHHSEIEAVTPSIDGPLSSYISPGGAVQTGKEAKCGVLGDLTEEEARTANISFG